MLVHMTPGEVQGLQALAMRHGGSLTINPQTGLPEAGFLSSLLPMLAGAALTAVSGGTLSPMMAAMMVGGGAGIMTGSLKKGLMAGLGAYGGANLGSSLSAMGAEAALNAPPTFESSAAANLAPSVSPQEFGLLLDKGATTVLPPTSVPTAPIMGSQNVGDMFAGVKQLGSTAGIKDLGGRLGYTGVGALATPLISGMMEQPKFTPLGKTPTPFQKFAYTPVNQRRNPTTGEMELTPGFYDSGSTYYAAEGGPIKYADGGGIASLDYVAGGKLLRGAGDGMSDSIPAVIRGPKPQRAALADGEFVIPADVVSHLGNGSTDAGAKRLYAMMDKVRHARTGNKKQGTQIKAERFVPA